MKVQFLKTLLDGNATTRKGTILEMDSWKASELIALGYAVHIPEVEKSVAAPLVATNDNKDESADPFTGRLAGGRGGSEKPALSLQVDQVRPNRKSTKRKGAAT